MLAEGQLRRREGGNTKDTNASHGGNISSRKDGASTSHVLREGTNLERNPKLFTKDFVLRLTPRSKKACRMIGIVPNELIMREYSSFYRAGMSVQIQKLRFQDYERTRIETIKMAKDQRLNVIKKEAENHPHKKAPKKSLSFRHRENSLVQMERMRMEKMLRSQNKELEAMLSYELKMASLIEKQEAKLANRREREEKQHAEHVLRRLEREKKQKETLKQLAANERQKMREEKERAKLAYNAKQERMRKKQSEEKEERLRKKQKQAEKDQKRRENEARHARLMEEERQEMLRRMEEIEEKERKRQERMAAMRAMKAATNRRQQEIAAERHAKVIEQKEESLELQRLLFEQRERELQKRRAEFEFQKNTEYLMKREAYQEKEKQRKAKLNLAKKKEEARIKIILQEQRRVEERLKVRDAERHEQQVFRQEVAELNMMRKRRNVMRQQRQLEYQREQLIERITKDAKRTEALQKQKNALLLVRKRNKIAAQHQKQNLAMIFSKLKSAPSAWKALAAPKTDAEESTSDMRGGTKRLVHSSSAILKPDALQSLLAQASPNPRGKGMPRSRSHGFLLQR